MVLHPNRTTLLITVTNSSFRAIAIVWKSSTPKGDFLHIFEEKGSGEGQLRDPRGMIIDSKDNLVCDSGNHGFLEFTTNGRAFAVGLLERRPVSLISHKTRL